MWTSDVHQEGNGDASADQLSFQGREQQQRQPGQQRDDDDALARQFQRVVSQMRPKQELEERPPMDEREVRRVPEKAVTGRWSGGGHFLALLRGRNIRERQAMRAIRTCLCTVYKYGKGVLCVKGILSQPVVAGGDLAGGRRPIGFDDGGNGAIFLPFLPSHVAIPAIIPDHCSHRFGTCEHMATGRPAAIQVLERPSAPCHLLSNSGHFISPNSSRLEERNRTSSYSKGWPLS